MLLTYPSQLLDMAGIDLFGMMSKEYMESLPGPMAKMGIDIEISYVGRVKDSVTTDDAADAKDISLCRLTADAKLKAEHSVTSTAVQPGMIDILMIPGPPPSEELSEETLDFVRKHARHGTTILVICTGCYVAAKAGILDNRKSSAPRALVPELRKSFPLVKWDDERRFVKDTIATGGKFKNELWTSGKPSAFDTCTRAFTDFVATARWHL